MGEYFHNKYLYIKSSCCILQIPYNFSNYTSIIWEKIINSERIFPQFLILFCKQWLRDMTHFESSCLDY